MANNSTTVNAKITLLFGEDGLRVSLNDEDSGCVFLKLNAGPAETLQILSGMGRVPVTCQVSNIEKIGKKLELSQIEFPVPAYAKDRVATAIKEAKKHVPEGWVPDLSFGSRGSFFDRGGESYARCAIRRWV